VSTLIDFLLHSDQHLTDFIATYGRWVYGILFAIVFAETGFVVTPFLPGDSLLFAVGALAATGRLDPALAFTLLALAAFTGNAVNYTAGRIIGPRVIGAQDGSAARSRFVNPAHFQRAHAFFEQYGGKAVILARFVPIVRTFMPFVAGAAQMGPSQFLLYNLVGAVGWVALCMGAGFVFGNVPIVKDNFSLVTIGIVMVSLLPVVIEFLRHRSRSPRAGTSDAAGRDR
jgi:membrane-associated protein